MLPFIMKGGSALLHNSKIFFFTMRAAVGLVSIQVDHIQEGA
jgi:hypothetical protein